METARTHMFECSIGAITVCDIVEERYEYNELI
jgi:hypothetical protein